MTTTTQSLHPQTRHSSQRRRKGKEEEEGGADKDATHQALYAHRLTIVLAIDVKLATPISQAPRRSAPASNTLNAMQTHLITVNQEAVTSDLDRWTGPIELDSESHLVPLTLPLLKQYCDVIQDDTDNLDPWVVSLIYGEDWTKLREVLENPHILGARYKPVDKKVKPLSGEVREDQRVRRQLPEDPLKTLVPLPHHPPEFTPTAKLTTERMASIKVNEGFLWPEEEKLFQYIFATHEKALAFEESDRGTFREDYFTPYIIPTAKHTPWVEKNIPIPPGIRNEVIDLMKSKIEAGVYERSQSSYRSKFFCVLKKNGKLRLVHDLQPLNKVTFRDAGVPPILDEFVEPFAGHQCYTVLDLFWAFDARKLHPDSRHLTAFQSPLGPLQLTSMPMGFTNSPAEFQSCMTFILQDEIPHVANVFIDDLPIKGPKTQYLDQDGNPEVIPENPGIRRFIWEHAQDVHRVIQRIKQAGLTFSAAKAQVARPNVIIVGQKCTPEGRVPEDDKVEKIKKWPQPRNVKDVRGFLGLCGTVRIWIKDFSKRVKPLRKLTLKDTTFEWTSAQEEAFQDMKAVICSAPALMPIDYTSERPVILAVDSSIHAIGFILMQIDEQGRRRPARYGSLPINPVEANYSQAKLELYGLYRALRHWRLYLVGIKTFVVETDAKYIKGMLNDPDLQPNATLNRWIQGIFMFDFTLVHVPGTQHQGADALSRRAPAEDDIQEPPEEDEWLENMALYIGVSPSEVPQHFHISRADKGPTDAEVMLVPATSQDKTLCQIFHFLDTLELPTFRTSNQQYRFIRKCQNYFLREGYMYRRYPARMPARVVFSEEERERILEDAHDHLGHKGEKATFETISLRFFWPFYRNDVRKHIRSCRECQRRSIKKIEVPLIISTPTQMFFKVYLDIMFMPKAHGFTCIVACRDDLSGVTEGRALRGASAREVARFFWEQIICRYGAVHQVVTDNGSETKGAFEILVERYGIQHVRISPYNSKANGVVERGHFILREALIKACEGKINRWPELLPLALFADRISIRRATGFSPYYLLHGTHPALPMDLREATFMVQGFQHDMSPEDLLHLRIRQLQKKPEDVARASDILRHSRLASKEHFEQRFAHRLQREAFQPGDLVLVRNTAVEREMNRKHKPRYLGPYEVVRRTYNGAYVIKELNGDISRESVAAFRLLAYDPASRDIASMASDPIQALGEVQTTRNLGEQDLEELIPFDDNDQEDMDSDDEGEDHIPISQRTRSQQGG